MSAVQPTYGYVKIRRDKLLRSVLAAVLIGGGYFIGAKIGFALTFQSSPVSTFWPPNSILFAALLSQPRSKRFLLLAAFPAHLLVQLDANIPPLMILCWFVSNCSEALIGASIFRYVTNCEIRFDNQRHVSMFILIALCSAFLSSFIDAGFVRLNQFENSSYWLVFRMRMFSNMLAALTLVPLIISWRRFEFSSLRNGSWKRYLEAAWLVAAFLIVGLVTFSAADTGLDMRPAFLYLPLPLLLWAAIRFGPIGSSSALLAVSMFEIWAAINDLGPFATQSPEMNALSVQLFLVLISLPLMLLAASIKESERAQAFASQKQARLELALDAAQQTSQALSESQERLHRSHNQIRQLLGRLIDVQDVERRRISRELHDDLNQEIATLSLSMSRVKKKIPMQNWELVAELDRLRQLANGLMNRVRQLSHQLHPAVLEHPGLVRALESYIADFTDAERIDVQLTTDVGDERIPSNTSICLYRVAVEALQNVARHSGAESASISLTRSFGNWELRVCDSGKGFDVEAFSQSGGLGLISVEERLRLLEGSCEIRATSGHGTTLVARVPCRSKD